MARRRKQEGIIEILVDLFMEIPAWVCPPAAVLAYLGVRIGLPWLAGSNIFLRVLAQEADFFARIAGLVVLATGFTAAVNKWQRRRLYDQQTGIDSIRDLSWGAFELLIGEAYRRQGYRVTENGSGGPDGGVDLILCGRGERLLVQCKQWKVYKVGVKPIRELYGVLTAERADRAIFVTSGVYTKEAVRFADGKPLELIDGAQLSRMITPVSIEKREKDLSTNPGKSSDTECLPACPLCQSPVVLRTAKRGTNAGNKFLGCSSYPKCRYTRDVAQQSSATAFT